MKWPSETSEEIFHLRYAKDANETWYDCINRVIKAVITPKVFDPYEAEYLTYFAYDFKVMFGGRYLANAGAVEAKYWSNCYCLKAEEDSREEWAELTKRQMLCLMSGGGIGINYSILRPAGHSLRRTGGISSGPIPLMLGHNGMARQIRQGGNRRAAAWAGLDWQHEDIMQFIHAKDWTPEVIALKQKDPDFPAPLDQTNISVCFDDIFLHQSTMVSQPQIWGYIVEHMCKTGEPGLAFNFGRHANEILRNACTEFTSEDDSDVCNLASVNMGAIDTIDEFRDAVALASKFLVCGNVRGDLPYPKAVDVRKRNNKIGLGLMGIHEWFLKRGRKYDPDDTEYGEWLNEYELESTRAAKTASASLSIRAPKAYRAIAPTGTTAILAGTTSGIEPLFATAYIRRYVGTGNEWREQVVIDPVARRLIREYGIHPDDIETSFTLAREPERRLKFQYVTQKYVDMGISSTINLPAWGTDYNNPDTARDLARLIALYCPGLRGITCYPDGSRGNQPLQPISYYEATRHLDATIEANEDACISGVCGI